MQFNKRLKMKLKSNKCSLTMTSLSRSPWSCVSTDSTISLHLPRHTRVPQLDPFFRTTLLISQLQRSKPNIMWIDLTSLQIIDFDIHF